MHWWPQGLSEWHSECATLASRKGWLALPTTTARHPPPPPSSAPLFCRPLLPPFPVTEKYEPHLLKLSRAIRPPPTAHPHPSLEKRPRAPLVPLCRGHDMSLQCGRTLPFSCHRPPLVKTSLPRPPLRRRSPPRAAPRPRRRSRSWAPCRRCPAAPRPAQTTKARHAVLVGCSQRISSTRYRRMQARTHHAIDEATVRVGR